MGEVVNYKSWAITQRIKELTKALRRVPVDSILYNVRKEEIENLKKDLSGEE